MSSHEMWRHTLVILSNVECARIGWSDVQDPPPPHTTPKLQLDFLDLKVKLKFRGGGGVWHQTPPPPPPLNFHENLKFCIQWHNVPYLGFQ